jgi:hypothetical protein
VTTAGFGEEFVSIGIVTHRSNVGLLELILRGGPHLF